MTSKLRTASLLARSLLTARPAPAKLVAPATRVLQLPKPLSTLRAQARAFSSSPARLGGGQTDLSLSAKLAQELTFEEDQASAEAGQLPDWLEEFQSNGVWKILDTPGEDEVSLERHFGDEKLKLTFSISDLDNPPDTSDLAPATSDSTSSPDSESLSNAAEPTFPVRSSLYITKPTHPGCLVLDLLVEDEQFVVDNVSWYAEKAVAADATAEGDWRRRGVYVGPRFDHLDTEVQEQFEFYLEERDISAGLAEFIPLYCEYKEQKEYVAWLKNVKDFIDV